MARGAYPTGRRLCVARCSTFRPCESPPGLCRRPCGSLRSQSSTYVTQTATIAAFNSRSRLPHIDGRDLGRSQVGLPWRIELLARILPRELATDGFEGLIALLISSINES